MFREEDRGWSLVISSQAPLLVRCQWPQAAIGTRDTISLSIDHSAAAFQLRALKLV